jgi:16S rRNA processing protein RimM
MPARSPDGPSADSTAGRPPKPHTSREPSQKPLRSPQKAPDSGFVAVGRVLAPFGLKGEVKVQSLTDNPERLRSGSRIYAGAQPLTIVASREAAGFTYLTFEGHRDRSSVEALRHRILQVGEDDLPPLPAGEYYRFQLVGLRAVDASGTALGTVAEIIETGANDVLRIERDDQPELLVPLLDTTVVAVDLAAGAITLDPPDWR